MDKTSFFEPMLMRGAAEEGRYFDLKALAAYASLSVRSLRSYVADPIDPLPSFRVRKKILVKKSDFDAWLKKHRVEPHELDPLIDEVLADVL
jgi:hypothetical protein